MRFNRFVFLNRPMLSLETHLGVTTSPQAPFPTDYVTLSVFDKSPPLRLTPSRSRRRAEQPTRLQLLLVKVQPHQLLVLDAKRYHGLGQVTNQEVAWRTGPGRRWGESRDRWEQSGGLASVGA